MDTHHDPLTQLLSQPRFDADLQQAIDAGAGVALALIDIDYFKEINDSYGHELGNAVLKQLGNIIAAGNAPHAYRIGGDEFASLMPGSTLEQAFLRMEQLRVLYHNTSSEAHPQHKHSSVTIGVAHYPRDAKDMASLIAAASAAQAAAKESGRNQVSLPPNEEMVMKSCYYSSNAIQKLRALSKKLNRKESPLLREALDDLIRKYDAPRA